ncbi:MAG: response regulator [Candidatus Omnitrophota bacterium]|jgi:two-component system response regulator VicR
MKKRILIVDDEESYTDVLKINLEDTGAYEVQVAMEAPSGLALLEKNTYDVILLDILMPKMEGHEALEKIRKISKIPVIIMSSYITPQQQSLVIKAGAASAFLKDQPFDAIHSIIKRVIAGAAKA